MFFDSAYLLSIHFNISKEDNSDFPNETQYFNKMRKDNVTMLKIKWL